MLQSIAANNGRRPSGSVAVANNSRRTSGPGTLERAQSELERTERGGARDEMKPDAQKEPDGDEWPNKPKMLSDISGSHSEREQARAPLAQRQADGVQARDRGGHVRLENF